MQKDFSKALKENIQPEDLVPLNAFAQDFPISIDMVYADPSHNRNMFGNLYHPKAQVLWAHKDLALITLQASLIANRLRGWTFKINDCLRPTEAQVEMTKKEFHPDLVSTPGVGGHPRAMAIDIEPLEKNGSLVPLGVPFDYFVKNPDEANNNPAARTHNGEGWYFGARHQVILDRQSLQSSMEMAADFAGMPIRPLEEEVWDFRFFDDHVYKFKPLSDFDVEPYQRMMNPDVKAVEAILNGEYPHAVRQSIEEVRDRLVNVYGQVDYDQRGNDHFYCDSAGKDKLPAEEYQPPGRSGKAGHKIGMPS